MTDTDNSLKPLSNDVKMALVAAVKAVICDDTSSSSSSSSEDNDDNDDNDLEIDRYLLYIALMRNMTIQVNVSEKVGLPIRPVEEPASDWYSLTVVQGYSRYDFKEHFRMFPDTFEVVLEHIGSALNVTNKLNGRKPMDSAKQMLLTLWFMATPDSYRSVSERFGVGKGTAHRTVRRVTYALHCLAPNFIKWPRGITAELTIDLFNKTGGFPNVIGAMGCTHIKVRPPKNNAELFTNSQGDYSMVMQAVCDCDGLFTHCYAGPTGAVRDGTTFRYSPVADFVEDCEHYFPGDSHIIASSAYPIHRQVMVPFIDNGRLTLKQKNFNYSLSSSRVVVEQTFQHLKIRFCALQDSLPLSDLSQVPEFLMACCVLHNICILQEDNFEVPDLEVHDLHDNMPVDEFYSGDAGRAKRIAIMNMLPRSIID